jgi:hypothetical protein
MSRSASLPTTLRRLDRWVHLIDQPRERLLRPAPGLSARAGEVVQVRGGWPVRSRTSARSTRSSRDAALPFEPATCTVALPTGSPRPLQQREHRGDVRPLLEALALGVREREQVFDRVGVGITRILRAASLRVSDGGGGGVAVSLRGRTERCRAQRNGNSAARQRS